MSRVTRARVLRGEEASAAVPLRSTLGPPLPAARRVAAAEIAAQNRARQLLEAARVEAEALLLEAQREADELRLRVQESARADALAHVALTLARIRDRERAIDERQLDRTVALATLVAERLLGQALALDPARVAALARTALDEATGARAVGIVAHPEDALLLRRLLPSTNASVSVTEDAALARGDLRLETDIGVLEARVGDRIARLGERLRESLAR